MKKNYLKTLPLTNYTLKEPKENLFYFNKPRFKIEDISSENSWLIKITKLEEEEEEDGNE